LHTGLIFLLAIDIQPTHDTDALVSIAVAAHWKLHADQFTNADWVLRSDIAQDSDAAWPFVRDSPWFVAIGGASITRQARGVANFYVILAPQHVVGDCRRYR
jgi:hypothetical protein